MRKSGSSNLIFITFLWLTSINHLISQDSTNLITDLRKSIFPENRREDNRITYYGCITSNDSLILYIRKVQPDIEATIGLLHLIVLNQNKHDTIDLHQIYDQQIKLFKQEWGCGLRQFPLCADVKNQLKLVHALETAMTSFRFDELYPTPQQKLEYWKQASDIFYIKMFKQNPRFEKYLSQEANDYIHSLEEQDIKDMENKLIWIEPYYREIYKEKNAFGSVSLEWSFITPFIGELKKGYQNLYKLFQEKTPNNSLEYKLEEYFFKQYPNKQEFTKLISE